MISEEGEILLFNKPEGWSSFQLVKKVKWLTKMKTGHAGTLDPLATGLMLLATGKFTKKLESIQNMDKEYTGTFILGAITASYDLETPCTEKKDISHLTDEIIYMAVKKFEGKIAQTPPIHSAIKLGGVPSYELARKGQTPELKERTIEITSFEITEINLPRVYFKVRCSKGTYIRTLANDFGAELGVGAYLGSLCRTAIGDYRLEEAWEIENFAEMIRKQKEVL